MLSKQKNIFKKPSIVEIVPKDCYQKNLTDIPSKLQTDENITNKRVKVFLGYIKDFILKCGKNMKLNSDNGKECVQQIISWIL